MNQSLLLLYISMLCVIVMAGQYLTFYFCVGAFIGGFIGTYLGKKRYK